MKKLLLPGLRPIRLRFGSAATRGDPMKKDPG
jgi:hypothetical protein